MTSYIYIETDSTLCQIKEAAPFPYSTCDNDSSPSAKMNVVAVDSLSFGTRALKMAIYVISLKVGLTVSLHFQKAASRRGRRISFSRKAGPFSMKLQL